MKPSKKLYFRRIPRLPRSRRKQEFNIAYYSTPQGVRRASLRSRRLAPGDDEEEVGVAITSGIIPTKSGIRVSQAIFTVKMVRLKVFTHPEWKDGWVISDLLELFGEQG